MGKKLLILVCVVCVMGFVSIGWDIANGQDVELSQDDGSAETGWSGNAAGFEMHVVFQPERYPCTIKKAKFYLTATGSPFKVVVRGQDSLTDHPGLPIMQPLFVQPVMSGWYTTDLIPITIQSGYFSVGMEFSVPLSPSLGSDLDPPISNRSWDFVFQANEWLLFPENYMIRAVVEYPPMVNTSTTTTEPQGICRVCPILCGLGANSEETALLRNFRDEVLSKTAEGREIIKLYYQWGPLVARAMEADEEFKADVTGLIAEILPIVGESVE